MTTKKMTERSTLEALPRDPDSLIPAIVEVDPKFYFRDGLVGMMIDMGLPVVEATRAWALSYTGTNDFVLSVAGKVRGGKPLTARQARALLNCAIKEGSTTTAPSASTAPPVEPELRHRCFVCDEPFATIREASEHRVRTHVGARSLEPDPAPRPVEPRTFRCRGCTYTTTDTEAWREHRRSHYKPLFEDVPESGLDLSVLPTGRYAVPDLDSGSGDYIFLTVNRIKRDHDRTKKFRFGWVSYGRERVVAGTIEVRQWRGDTKELVGEQRPGETYRGTHLREFGMILADPTASAKLFGMLINCCGRCGKTLTDPESRGRGIGPDCVKHFNGRPGTDVHEHETAETLTKRIRTIAVRGGLVPA